MDNTDLPAWLRLPLTSGVGNVTARKLLAALGSADAVFAQNAANLRELGGDKLVEALRREPPGFPEQLQLTRDWLDGAAGRRIACLGDVAYPASLLEIEDPPLLLYMEGAAEPAPAAGRACMAIVGSRNPTPQGLINAREFARALAAADICVVSGMALGIDGAAHDGALRAGGRTIAVVGTGLDLVYPQKHLELARRIVQQGTIVSEFALGTPPLTAHFPRRNRIIAGLSLGTLVVEAALRSGSLITARLASEQGREVFAIPGSIHSPQSRGCHALIRQGAKLVESVNDILEELRLPEVAGQAAPAQDTPTEAPAGIARTLLRALGFDTVGLDALQARTGLATAALQAQLLELELAGQVARLPGGLFQRIASS